MGNMKLVVTLLAVAILFVAIEVGTVEYYNGVLSNKYSQIASLNAQITSQNNQISNLTSKAKLFPNIVTYLGVKEENAMLCYYLNIAGSVVNTGQGAAYNAGLHVTGFASNGTELINMTIPLANNMAFGTDDKTRSYSSAGFYDQTLAIVGNLYFNQSAAVSVKIYHEGLVSNWTITPVWTSS